MTGYKNPKGEANRAQEMRSNGLCFVTRKGDSSDRL